MNLKQEFYFIKIKTNLYAKNVKIGGFDPLKCTVTII